MLGEPTRSPPAQILGRIGRGPSHGRGEESRLGPSQRTGSQRRRDSSTTPRWLKSRYPPSRIASTATRVTKRRRYGRPVLEDLAADDPHRHYRAAAYHAIRSTLPEDVPL
jgi:hypothetical protein